MPKYSPEDFYACTCTNKLKVATTQEAPLEYSKKCQDCFDFILSQTGQGWASIQVRYKALDTNNQLKLIEALL